MKFLKVIVAVIIWFILWFVASSPYTLYNFLPNFISNLSLTTFFGLYSLWILIIAVVAVFMWKKTVNNFNFLKIKNNKILFLYLIPIALSIYILICGNGINNINRPLYVIALATTTFIAQDMVTFGFLQTYLEKVTNRKYAAIITGLAFFIGHLCFSWSITTLILLSGASLFSFLRYKTKNIYLLNIIHITFLLLPIG